MSPIYVNGRFASRPLTGVQRFAGEMTAALAALWDPKSAPPTLLVPPGTATGTAPGTSAGTAAGTAAGHLPIPLPVRSVGYGRGHLWEQVELPFHAADGLLVNLANAAPVMARRQVVVIHDAGVFANAAAYSTPYRLWHQRLGWALSRSGATIVTVSAFSRDEIARHLHIDPNVIAVVSEGADHMLRVAADMTVLARHGLEPNRYIVAVGSLAAHKNLASLTETAAMLHARGGFKLVLVGDLRAAVLEGETALPQPAELLGRIDDSALRALYESAAGLVFPSRYEGFGLPPIEAMACGCPVVASTAPALVEICGDAALYCDPDDRTGIAATVRRLIEDPALASDMRRRGSAHVASLTWENAARLLLPVLLRAAAECAPERAAA